MIFISVCSCFCIRSFPHVSFHHYFVRQSSSEYNTVFVVFLWLISQSIRLHDSNAVALGLEIIEVTLESSFCMFSPLHTELDQDVPITVWESKFVCSPSFLFILVLVVMLAWKSSWWFSLMDWHNYARMPFWSHRSCGSSHCPFPEDAISNLFADRF